MTELARTQAEMPPEAGKIVDRRELERDFPLLASVLRPGLRVLDVGCEGGAITRGVAERVGPGGCVVGLDANARLLAAARERNADLANLEFVEADAYALPYQDEFDVVSSARVPQWLERPADALTQLVQAARPGGQVIVLDYNHLRLEVRPDPPASFLAFHKRYLAWRAAAGMDNELADHLEGMFQKCGLEQVKVYPHHETTRRGEPEFQAQIGLKAQVIASRGRQLVADGWLSEAARAQVESDFRWWVASAAEVQTLYLLAVSGRKPLDG